MKSLDKIDSKKERFILTGSVIGVSQPRVGVEGMTSSHGRRCAIVQVRSD